MSPRLIDRNVQNYTLRRNAYFAMANHEEEQGLYVINSLFKTITSIRNPKITFMFRELLQMGVQDLVAAARRVHSTLSGFQDTQGMTEASRDDAPDMPRWAVRLGDLE